MTILKAPSDEINKLLKVIGIDYHNVYSVDLHIEAGKDVQVTVVKLMEAINSEMLKGVKKYKLVEVE